SKMSCVRASTAASHSSWPASAVDRALEQRVEVLHAAHRVVVEHDAADAAILGKRARLRLNLLCREDPLHGREPGVPLHALKVAAELLDTVDLAAALDFDGDGGSSAIASKNIDRPDRRHVLAPHKLVTITQQLDLVGEQLLQMRFNTVF